MSLNPIDKCRGEWLNDCPWPECECSKRLVPPDDIDAIEERLLSLRHMEYDILVQMEIDNLELRKKQIHGGSEKIELMPRWLFTLIIYIVIFMCGMAFSMLIINN